MSTKKEFQGKPKVSILLATAAIIILFSTCFSHAYFVGPALSLDHMAANADLVIKAKAISNTEVDDSSFQSIPGYAVFATKLHIISVLKGNPGSNTITFRHYGIHQETNKWIISNFEPQHYELTEGRSYIVFALKSATGAEFMQIWKNHTTKRDQGVFRTANDHPLKTEFIKQACWQTLVDMQASTNSEDVVYGINQLDALSGGTLEEFPRKEVVDLLRPHLASSDLSILKAAIYAASSGNPYLAPGRGAAFWLASVGKGHLPGLFRTDPKFDNESGRALWHELSALADTNFSTDIRCDAIKALGKSGVTELKPFLQKWANDSDPLVRQTAIELLPDFLGAESDKIITNAINDSADGIRQGVALAIGFGQRAALIPLLDKLLGDKSQTVRNAAAMSLLSFSPTESGDIMRKHLHDSDYRGVFVNALAINDAAHYLAELRENIVTNQEPANFWGGKMISADSWDILFMYVRSLSTEELRSGKFDSSLDALEKMQWFSSSEPRDLYALYLQRGLTERAKAFREACKHTVHFDMEYYFNMVDQSPGTYEREVYY